MNLFKTGKGKKLSEDVEVRGDKSDLEVKCPNCNRWKSLEYFLSNTCDCDFQLVFKIELREESKESKQGFTWQ